MRLSATIIAFTFAASLGSAATATVVVPIKGLFNTGVDGSNVTLGNNAIDSHYKLTAAPTGITLGNAYTGVRNASFPIGPWLANTTVSRWLTPTVSHINIAPGDYTYSLQFTLTPKLIPTTGKFTGRFLTDNSMVSIFLNSTQITAPVGSFTTWSNFSSAGGFVAGLNTITFKTRNGTGATGNPTGVRVEFVTNSIEALPEPGVWVMLITGFGLTGAILRRRRALATA